VKTYDELSKEMLHCTKCGLCTTRHTVVVDRGDPDARLMLIGESPGANEDATGQAFVGRAGTMLDELLAEVGIEKFLIVNVLKCRPPNNKFPGDAEAYHTSDVVAECLPWLDQQIGLVKPRVIILVGGKAASYTIYRGSRAPAVRDIVHRRLVSEDYPGIDIFGMYHTSYMLRLSNQDKALYESIREETLKLLQGAKRIIEGDSSGMSATHVARRPDKGDQLSFF